MEQLRRVSFFVVDIFNFQVIKIKTYMKISEVTDPQLQKEERELAKIESGIAKVFLKNVKDREKIKQWKRDNLDPRNASR